MEYAIQLVAPILLGLFAGVWLDNHTQIRPWGTLGGLLVGLLLGFGSLYKRAMSMIQKQKAKSDKKDS